MKIKQVQIKKFKRFTNLSIINIPETAKLIVLVGPNGSGKTSLFEAFNYYYLTLGYKQRGGDRKYYEKKGEEDLPENQNWYVGKVVPTFHSNNQYNQNSIKGKFYFRSAYRNEADFTTQTLTQINDPTEQITLRNLANNDKTVSDNYQRLVSQTLSEVFEEENTEKTVKDIKNKLIGKIEKSMSNIFNGLNLSSIGDPLINGSFFFEKGSSKDFHYKNLSAGEKSTFDLILDIIIKSNYYQDAVFCIDEPEAHIHTRLQSKLLKELYDLTPDNSQLWISTHSIGMLKQAEEIEKKEPGSVVFLDFGNRDFDSPQIMEPVVIGKAIWERFFELAIGDFSKLIAPQKIVFCEGDPSGKSNKNFDANIYNKIFARSYNTTQFVSIGSRSELENLDNKSMNIVSNILKSSEIIKFVDRDDNSPEEIEELLNKGIKTGKRRHLESYLLDDEIITKLCLENGKDDLIEECLKIKSEAIAKSIERGYPNDDLKSASGQIYTEIKKVLGLTQCGNNVKSFLKDTIAPLITEETTVFKELESEIFS